MTSKQSSPEPIDIAPPQSAGAMPLEGTRKPYEKPRVLYREPLEAVAAACTPTPPGKSGPAEMCSFGSS